MQTTARSKWKLEVIGDRAVTRPQYMVLKPV